MTIWLTPLYLMFTASLLGLIGAKVIQVNAETLREEAPRAGRRPPTRKGAFAAKAVLSLVLARLLGVVEALVAFGIYGLHREAGVFGLFAFLALVAAASLFVAIFLLTLAGYLLGVLLGSLFIISLGLATSGGATPVQNLPEVLRSVADALPFKHASDGVRALLFYGGRADAGPGSALGVLSAYVAGSLLLGAAFSLARDALEKRKAGFGGEQKGTRAKDPVSMPSASISPGRLLNHQNYLTGVVPQIKVRTGCAPGGRQIPDGRGRGRDDVEGRRRISAGRESGEARWEVSTGTGRGSSVRGTAGTAPMTAPTTASTISAR